jgi:hypothetical protein
VGVLALALGSLLLAGWEGWVLELGGARLSARSPRNPLLLAIVAAGVSFALMPRGQRGTAVVEDCRALGRAIAKALSRVLDRGARARPVLPPALAAAASVAIVVVGFVEGAPVAGGSDSYGYVSQAHLWATGKLRVEPPLLDELAPVAPARALVPLGYILSADHETIVPTYSPGLPMVMAVFELLFGGAAVFWVVPLLGGLAVGSTYLLGRRVAGPWGGAAAALLAAASPVLLFQLTAAPMSDLPAAAWWTLSLALVLVDAPWAALAGGLAAALAILTRPNLVPLAIVPGAFLLWRAVSAWRRRGVVLNARSNQVRRLVLFVAGAVPGCLAVAAVHTHLYGSPLRSGYEVEALYGLEHAWANLVRYPQVLTTLESPLVWLAFAAPFLCWRWGPRVRRARVAQRIRSVASIAAPRTDEDLSRHARAGVATVAPDDAARDTGAAAVVSLCFVLAVFASYLFYPGFDAHTTLRFLLPGIPALMALLAASLVVIARRLPSPIGPLAGTAAVALIAVHGVVYARDHAAFDTAGELKYAVIGEHIARRLPENAVLLAMQHSGSARYYSGRPTVRYDLLPKRRFDRVLARLRRLGYRPYLVLEHWEEAQFRTRFQHRSQFGELDWPPLVDLEIGNVRIYDLADREAVLAGEERVTERLAWPYPR